jgi:hypothetical protein
MEMHGTSRDKTETAEGHKERTDGDRLMTEVDNRRRQVVARSK